MNKMPENKQLELNAAISVDAVIFTTFENALKVLLIKRSQAPFKNHWALPGGPLRKRESAKTAAERVLKEKAGIKNVYIEQLYTFDNPDRDPRGRTISIAHFALTPANIIVNNVKNAQHVALHAVDKLPEKLAFDHRDIIEYATERLRAKLEYTNAVYSLLPSEFTFSQLRAVYETILGRSLDKRNFRKKFLSLGLLERTGNKTQGGAHRPAKLYRFKNHELTELRKFF